MSNIYRLAIFTLLLFWGASAAAQSTGGFGSVDASGTSYHRFVAPGESTIDVMVLGAVASPGLYRVGEGTDLSQLVVLMGGNGLGVKAKNERRDVTVQLLRRDGDRRSVIYEASWEEMVENPGGYPVLQGGDLLQVDATVHQRQPFGWRDGLRILTSLGSIVILVDRVARAF